MLFVSYASQDRTVVDDLLSALQRFGGQVWLDDELGGGEAWWQKILENIRGCEVFVVALSNHSLASKPCQAELRYAQALRRPVLPVQIGSVDSVRVTPLAATQIIDYRKPMPDIDGRLAAALQHLRENVPPLPSPAPREPEVPFAYLMRLAGVLDRKELNHSDQADLVSELRNRLDEDCGDPSAHRDIVRLMYLLRDRADVTWRTRTDIDQLLAANDVNLSTQASGAVTIPLSAPARSATMPAAQPKPIARAQPTAVPAVDRPSRGFRRRWLIGGLAAVAVIGAGAVAVIYTRPASVRPESVLLSDAEIDAIMGDSGMEVVEENSKGAKPSSLIDVTPANCAGVIYPGLDRIYQDSGEQRLIWNVLERPGGVGRAGVNNNRFVDQDVASFADTDKARDFVQQSAASWEACIGQTVTVSYTDHSTYTWTVAGLAGDTLKIKQSFSLEGDDDYGCQRVLTTAVGKVFDVKACGQRITDEGSRIADRLVASVTNAPAF